MDCCNAKRDGKCLRYRKNWQAFGLTSADLRDAFERRAWLVFEDVKQHQFLADRLHVITGDGRKELGKIGDRTHDLVVTSPPYLNSFDYRMYTARKCLSVGLCARTKNYGKFV